MIEKDVSQNSVTVERVTSVEICGGGGSVLYILKLEDGYYEAAEECP